MRDRILLCHVDEIDDPGSKGFENVDDQQSFFIVRRGGEIFGYRNSCPHYGAPLDWKPDAFLSYGGNQILCSMHGALFNIDDGICTEGPCPGQGLTAIEVLVDKDKIYLKLKNI